ncbi:MAG: cyclase [Myxococcaceae bacterium]|nr:cyclase [Myxococcaceae bacterium]
MIANPLRASGLVDSATLDVGRTYQRTNGGLLSNALLHLNSVKEGDFLRIFAELYSTRFVKSDKLKTLKLDLALVEKVGVRLAERLRMCPIRWDEARGDLHVVAAVPLATNLDTELKKVIPARSVSVYVATAASVHALIRRWHYRENDAFDVVSVNGAGPHETAKIEPDSSEPSEPTQSAKTVMVKVDDTLTIATLRRENARYRVAQEFHRRVTLERSLESMIDRILSVIFELLPAEGAAIWLNSGKFATKSIRAGEEDAAMEIPRAVIDQTLISKGGVLVNNALIDERFDRSESVMIRGVQSVMAVPLRARNQTLGVLYVDSISQSAAFSEDDLPLLESIGAQAAILLDNAELLAKVKQEVENRSNLSRFLSPAAVEEVLSGRMALKLDGQAAVVTALFADIRGFTTMSSQMPPDEVVRILNRFFEDCVDAVEQNHGTVDKFMGDCVMALWGAPVAKPDDARNAMAAALQMVERARRTIINGVPLEMGVGINTGEVVLGAVGSRKRSDYTAIGSAVNLAARLCGIARAGEVLVTSDTLMVGGEGVSADSGEPVILKGIDVPITPYSLQKVETPQAEPIRLYNVATPLGTGKHPKTQPQPGIRVGDDTLPPTPSPRKRRK